MNQHIAIPTLQPDESLLFYFSDKARAAELASALGTKVLANERCVRWTPAATMKRLAVLVLAVTLAACTTVTQQINAVHEQVTGKLKADFEGVKEVGIASHDQQLTECADAVLADQIPPIEALDKVQVSGPFSTIALTNAKHDALKIKPSVAQKCSLFGWLLGQFGLIGGHL